MWIYKLWLELSEPRFRSFTPHNVTSAELLPNPAQFPSPHPAKLLKVATRRRRELPLALRGA